MRGCVIPEIPKIQTLKLHKNVLDGTAICSTNFHSIIQLFSYIKSINETQSYQILLRNAYEQGSQKLRIHSKDPLN